MRDFIEALNIFLKYVEDVGWPFHCSHDQLAICLEISPDRMDKGDVDRLEEIGIFWNEDDECFISFKYGSC